MNPGDTIICRDPRGYMFTEGKEYTVVWYEPKHYDALSGYTWPAYLTVMDDLDREVVCHAYRFVHKPAT